MRRWWLLVGMSTFALIVVGAGLLINAYRQPIPAQLRHGLNFPLYYPTGLPTGYAVDSTSFRRQDNVIIFAIKTPRSGTIAVSEAHLPIDLDLSVHQNPSGIKLPDEKNFTTSIGQAQMSLWGDKMVSSLVTQETWIILNVTGVSPRDAEAVTSSFRPL